MIGRAGFASGLVLMLGSLLILLWTNPTAPDLDRITFYAVSPYGDTLTREYRGRSVWEDQPPIIVPGAPDSLWWALPCRSQPSTWTFYMTAWDTVTPDPGRAGNPLGNESEPSNVVTYTKPGGVP